MTAEPALSFNESLLLATVIVVDMAVTSLAGQLLVRRDERRLDEARLERAWPPVTRDMVLGLGVLLGGPIVVPFGVFVHYARTRRSLLGALLGLAFAVLTILPALAVDFGVDLVIGD